MIIKCLEERENKTKRERDRETLMMMKYISRVGTERTYKQSHHSVFSFCSLGKIKNGKQNNKKKQIIFY